MSKKNWNPAGCPKCGREKVRERNKKGTNTWDKVLVEVRKAHGSRYEYIEHYTGVHQPLRVICVDHGEFNPSYSNHVSQLTGCPVCRISKGESAIARVLETNNVRYDREHVFDDCYGECHPLRFDFYLPDTNSCIEYDGEQHFAPVKFHKNMTEEVAVEMFMRCQKYDEIKNSYCFTKKIPLLRVNWQQLRNKTLVEAVETFVKKPIK